MSKKYLFTMAAMVALAAAGASELFAGAVGGPKRSHDCVLPGDTDVYTVRFWSGDEAMVIVSGDGSTDLDLYVFDENGNLIASDTDYTDDCVVSFRPRWTGPFRIMIKNVGRVTNCYQIVTN